MFSSKEPRAPSFLESLFSLLSLVVGIGVSIVQYGMDPHIPMLLGVLVSSLVAVRCGITWDTIQDGMIKGISNSLQAMIILLLVGILVGVWILAGVVPTLIYYGLQVLTPEVFLPATLIICAVTALATGTSWGTTGTIGVALMGVGGGLGLPLPVVAGAVLSGAYFGDKMSPLSDTTNLAPAMAGTDLYTHIRHMMYTTSVTFGITFIANIFIGLSYGSSSSDMGEINNILAILEKDFFINPILILPPLLVMLVSYKKIPAIPGIAIGAMSGVIFAILFQDANYEQLVDVAFNGFVSNSGDSSFDELLSRGGLNSMLYTISLIIVAMMFGGVMEHTGQLKVIANKILAYADSSGSLIVSTVLTCIGANIIMCDQYMAIVMGGRTYAEAYRDRGLHAKNLSRAVEDSATVTANLIPWNSGGAYQAATLGVATIAYLPFNIFCWLSPIVTIIFGIMGWTIHPSIRTEKNESETITENTVPTKSS